MTNQRGTTAMAKNEAPETAAAPAKGKQVSTTVDPEFYAVLDEHHWDARQKISDIARTALYEYAQKRGLSTPGLNAEAPAEA